MALYAGFDCSTQSLSLVVLDAASRRVVFRHSLPFDEPFLPAADPGVVHASPRVWARTLERTLGVLAREVDASQLRAISGSAQQHGSVYCGERPDILTRPTAPIWMDSSAEDDCIEIEAALGGPPAAARLTGSRVFPRFTGPQIRKFARQEPEAYRATERIHLVSSYMASLLIGTHAPLDHADASGMALMDIRRKRWAPTALDATAPHLAAKLPPLVGSASAIGSLAARWRERFGFAAATVIAWSGDNPCSLVGTGLTRQGQLTISLGTSDTIFGPMDEPRVSADGTGHVFVSPLEAYMGITVFRNGSLARERVRDQFGMTWRDVSEALRCTPAGNGGAMMLPWFEPEITPPVPLAAVHRRGLEGASPEQHVRAIVEAQAVALARHSAWMGVTPRSIHATGGAAANREILQVIADVFGAEVRRFASTDAAALGAAMRALQADAGLPWEEVVGSVVRPLAEPVTPVRAHVETYRAQRSIYAGYEAAALSGPMVNSEPNP